MAPPARKPAAQAARRSTVASASVASRHDARRENRADDASACQLDWLQPALTLWLRDDTASSVRMGDVHPTEGV